MKLDEKIAEIRLKSGTKLVENTVFLQTGLKFRCQRCGVLCCRLGGPQLLSKDVERLEEAGFRREQFLNDLQHALKSRRDGSCIFLSTDTEQGLFKCSVYNVRPTLCRLYPFRFERFKSDSYMLKFIPCCRGLNADNGDSIDERFFDRFLKDILIDLLNSEVLPNQNSEKEKQRI